MKNIISALLTLTLVACASTPAPLPLTNSHPTATLESLQKLIRSEMAAKSIPGLSISVADSQKTLWSQGFGEARKGKLPFTTQTISNVGSVSKTITATAILRMVDQGKVTLDAPLTTYLPEFHPSTRGTKLDAITIRGLLSHESGLSGATMFEFMSPQTRPSSYPNSLVDVLAQANLETVPRGPNQVFAYSNMAFALLGLVVERVSGQSFNDLVTHEIFAPLGMKDSSFLVQENKLERYALGYLGGKEGFVPYIRDLPAGSLCSTADDMALFLRAILNSWKAPGGLISQPLAKQMFTAQNLGVKLDFDFRVGLTWWIVDFQSMPGEFAVGHGGDLPPYHALVAILPERDLSVAVLVNGVDGVGSFSLTDILTEALATFALTKGQTPLAAPRPAGAISPVATVPAGLADRLVGFYATPAGICQVKRDGAALKAFAFGNWFDLTYHEDRTFTLGMKILGLIPLNLPVLGELSAAAEDLDGQILFNLRIKGLLLAPGVRISAVTPLPSWAARAGEYRQVNVEPSPMYQNFRLGTDLDTGFFCLFLLSEGQWTSFPLRTLNDSEAVLEGQGRSLGETVRVVHDATGDHLLWSGIELRRQN